MVPTRYGQHALCGVFVGLAKTGDSVQALYIPTISFSEYKEDSAPGFTMWLDCATEPTSSTNGKLNTARIDVPSFRSVATANINGYSGWYVPSVREVCMIYELVNQLPMQSSHCNTKFNSASPFVHTSTVVAVPDDDIEIVSGNDDAKYAVEQVYMPAGSVKSFFRSLNATMILMRSDTIARKL